MHLAHAGHPIIGDDLYGVTGEWIGRQALHAARLEVAHPRTKQKLSIEAPLPHDFEVALRMLGLTP